MNIKPVFEFLLWDNCNNDCQFCYQKQNYNPLTETEKKTAIDQTIAVLCSDTFIKGSHVLLVGGELFDSPKTFANLHKLIDCVVDMMIKDYIDLLYINTNLIYKKLDGVQYLLDKVSENDLFNRLKFTTSYDKQGRFKTIKTHDLMLANLAKLVDLYPRLNVVVNIMLSKLVCDQILNDDFNIKSFCDRYKCDVNLIPYIILDKSITAPRNNIFKTLRKVNQQIPGFIERYINNLDLNQQKLLYRYDKITSQYQFCSSADSECGHSENFKLYSDKGTCFVCDLKVMFND